MRWRKIGGSRARGGLCGACLAVIVLMPASAASGGVPQPVYGRTFVAEVLSGAVLVKPKGSEKFEPFTNAEQLDFGSWIDATHGKVRITSAADRTGATQAGNFFAGKFRVFQASGPSAYTLIRLEGGDFGQCNREGAARTSAARKTASIRRVWGNGKGKFRTAGKYSAATVVGTYWLTEDRCDGTLTRVRHGTVRVRDFVRHRTAVVKAGGSYLARPE